MKNQNILDVNNKEYDYQMGVYYMDIIAECEKLGDYVVNVVEASSDENDFFHTKTVLVNVRDGDFLKLGFCQIEGKVD